VAIHTMCRIRVNALPARQEAVKVIVEPAAVDDLFVAFCRNPSTRPKRPPPL